MDVLGLDGYFFDGTGNHPNEINPECHREHGEKNYITNVRRMWEAYNGGKATYIYGIGSGYSADGKAYSSSWWNLCWDSWGNSKMEGGLGKSFDSRVEYAIKKFEDRLLSGDKDSKLIDVVGFSRGAAESLEFLHRISDGIKSGKYPKDIKIRTVNLYDTVGAIGWSGNLDFGDWNKRLSMPSSNDLNYLSTPVQAVALDEQRAEFQVKNLTDTINIGFRGVHSDIGGGYNPNGNFLASISLLFIINGANNAFPNLYDTSRLKYGNYNYNEIMKLNQDLEMPKNNYNKSFYQTCYEPNKNSSWEYNDKETRVFPNNMMFHSSVDWLSSNFKNGVGFFYSNDFRKYRLGVNGIAR